MKWDDGKSYDEKYKRVTSVIQNAQALGFTVSIIGESAGASIGMNVFAASKDIHRFVSLCGVNNPKTSISSHIFARSPAFKESVSQLAHSRAKAIRSRIDRITVVTARRDSTVPVEQNTIPGARTVKIWSMGHGVTIMLCLSLLSFVIVREVRRRIA
jgi:hypothetical protein